MGLEEWAVIAGAVAAIAAAGVSIAGAVQSRGQRRLADVARQEAEARADDANSALSRIATSNEALAEAARPKAWGVPKRGGGAHWTIRNTSGRSVELLAVEAKPAQAASLLKVAGALPFALSSGELLEFAIDSRMSLAVRSFTLVWRFSDDEDGTAHRSSRTL